MLTVVLAIVSTTLVLAALASIVLPLLPGGVPLAWLGLLVFAIGTRFERISVLTIVVFFVVTMLTVVLNFFITVLAAGRFRASRLGKWGAFLGSFFGVFMWGQWGTILGPFVGATLGELLSGRGAGHSLRVGVGATIGIIVGGLINIAIVLVMFGFLVASWF